MQAIPFVRSAFAIACAIHLCGCQAPHARAPSAQETEVCGPGGRLRTDVAPAVTTTVAPDGTVIDWVAVGPAQTDVPPPPPVPPPVGFRPAPMSPIPPHLQGPPGTVPIPRTPQYLCSCDPGYVAGPSGRCGVFAEQCVSEGGEASSKYSSYCCSGLSGGDISKPNADGSCSVDAPDAKVCIRCGDGRCGVGESYCNCPADCPRR